MAVDPDALAGRDEVVARHRQLARVEAVAARASAAFERSRAWEADGARTASAWLATRCRVPDHVARRRLRAGRVLPELPTTEAGWLAGTIGSSAVEQLAAARTEATAAPLAADEPELVRAAGHLHPRAFARLPGPWPTAADPDGVDADARCLHDGRRVHLSSTFEGAWVRDGVLDPVGGEILHNALSTVTRDLFRADWAEAKHAEGEQATRAALGRTPAQRRADALVELARRATAGPKGPRPPDRCSPWWWTATPSPAGCASWPRSRLAVAPGAVVRWLAQAVVERVVFDPADRVLGVGARRRLFTGAERGPP